MDVNFKAKFGFVLLISGIFLHAPGFADDSAAAIAAGGLVPRRETRIVMAKEVLQISEKKIVVDYDFRNDSDENVVTEVALPIPQYSNEFEEQEISEQSFQSFRVWVDGRPITYKIEAAASFHGKKVTALLRAAGIDIPTLGHFDDSNGIPTTRDFGRLSLSLKRQLIREGLFENLGDPPEKNQGMGVFARWTVHLQYHWTQVFPAHSTIHIRHEYMPALGFTQIDTTSVKNLLSQIATGRPAKEDSGGVKLLESFCADKPFLETMARMYREAESKAKTDDEKAVAGIAYPSWVDFILTSANTWKRPIGDFTLITERGKPEIEDTQRLVSFCSPTGAKVEKIDASRFRVHLTNFIPTSELHIGFFDVPQGRQSKTVSSKR